MMALVKEVEKAIPEYKDRLEKEPTPIDWSELMKKPKYATDGEFMAAITSDFRSKEDEAMIAQVSPPGFSQHEQVIVSVDPAKPPIGKDKPEIWGSW